MKNLMIWCVKESWTVHPQDVCCSRRAHMCPAKFYNIKPCETETGKPVTRYKYLPVCHMDSHDVLSYWNVYELHTVSATQKMITDMLVQHSMLRNLYKLKIIWDNPHYAYFIIQVYVIFPTFMDTPLLSTVQTRPMCVNDCHLKIRN